MHLEYTSLNWLAVIVAAVAAIVIGIVWYRPEVFGRRWATLSGRPLPQVGQIPPATTVGSIVVELLAAYVLAVIVKGLGAGTLADGAVVGFLAWLGFAATTNYGNVLYEGRTVAHWAINNGNTLIALLVMGAILGAWH